MTFLLCFVKYKKENIKNGLVIDNWPSGDALSLPGLQEEKYPKDDFE